jgi:hypothetical protein
MEWEKTLRDSVKNNSIKELHLKKIPTLKSCEDWTKVSEVGTVDHKTKYAHYKGGLVRLGENLYFLPDGTITALSQFRKWNFKAKITVTDIEK